MTTSIGRPLSPTATNTAAFAQIRLWVPVKNGTQLLRVTTWRAV